MADGTIFPANSATKRSFLDHSKPKMMFEAESVYRKLSFKYGETFTGAIEIGALVTEVITGTKSYEMDQVWSKIEKKLNGGRPISNSAKDDSEKVQLAYGLLYEALNTVDQTALSTNEVSTMKSFIFDAKTHIDSKFQAKMSTKNRRVTTRVGKTLLGRLDKIIARYNEMQEQGLIPGNQISTF